jgi:hypothetical protein
MQWPENRATPEVEKVGRKNHLIGMSGESIRVAINEKIGTGKVVVASLDGEQLPDTNKFIIQLFDASGNGWLPKLSAVGIKKAG